MMGLVIALQNLFQSLLSLYRFGIQLGVQPTDTGGPAQDSDLPLSEGFHWESIPGSPSVMPPVLPSSHADHLSEAQTDSHTQNSSGQPDVAQPGCSSKTAMQISMKVEPNLEGENEDLSSNSNANKRPRSMLEVSWTLRCSIHFLDLFVLFNSSGT